jgi:hypothetical protein
MLQIGSCFLIHGMVVSQRQAGARNLPERALSSILKDGEVLPIVPGAIYSGGWHFHPEKGASLINCERDIYQAALEAGSPR